MSQLTLADVINLKPTLDKLSEKMIQRIAESSVEVPPNGDEEMNASNLELLAQRLREGKIKQDCVTGHVDDKTGDFIISVRLQDK